MYLKFLLFISFVIKINAQLNGLLASNVEYESAFDQNLYESVLDEEKCEEQLNFLANNSAIASQFEDATGKLPSGVQVGNMADLGDYYQCLGIRHIDKDMDIQGKYCMLQIPMKQDITPDMPSLPVKRIINEWPKLTNETLDEIKDFLLIRRRIQWISGPEPMITRIIPLTFAVGLHMSWGTCVPKVCRPKQVIDYILRQSNINFTYSEFFCRLPNDKPYYIADYVAIGVFSLLALITALSTSYDLYQVFVLKKAYSQINTILRCFSIYTNTRRFLTFNTAPGALDCVDGIRAISMMWVIVGHTYALTLLMFIHNAMEVKKWLTSFNSVWINSAPITVDTFFLLSGIFCVYTLIGKVSRWKFIKNLHLFYLYRLFRILPLLATVILLQASFFHRVSDGPMWINMGHVTVMCRERWWSALLHVQNYLMPKGMCLYHTWYLSVDIQLYIASPVVLVWLFGNRVVAWCALVTAVLASLVSSSIYSFMYNYPAALSNPNRMNDINGYFNDYYINTLTRAPPFFIGMAYGYLLYKYRGKKVEMRTFLVVILWILSFAMMSFCIFTIYPIMQEDFHLQILDNFLNAYMRAIWALAVGWLIFACVHGYGGSINWFLSLQMWKLPARLSYAMYLVHYPIIMVANGSKVKTHYFTDGDTMYRFTGDFIFTIIAAFILCVTIDAPFTTIQKLIFGDGKQTPKEIPATKSQTNIIDENKSGEQYCIVSFL